MLPLIMAAGALAGLAKHRYIDEPKERRQRELAAKTAMYSPWTRMQPNEVQESSALGSAMQGGLTGFQMGQGMGGQQQGGADFEIGALQEPMSGQPWMDMPPGGGARRYNYNSIA